MTEEIFLCNKGQTSFASISDIVDLQIRCIDSKAEKIIIRFDSCEFISPSALTVLASIPLIGKRFKKNITLNFSTIENINLYTYLIKCGFMLLVDRNIELPIKSENAIAFKKFSIKDIENTELIYEYIDSIIKLIPLSMDAELEAEMLSSIYEVFKNAFDHSKTRDYVYACGHYYENKNILTFCLYDCGVGIPHNVREYLKSPHMTSTETLKWALHSGHTTVIKRDYPRGLGFGLLSEFSSLNGGNITLLSDDAKCKISNFRTELENINSKLIGTMFTIEIKNDPEHIYRLKK